MRSHCDFQLKALVLGVVFVLSYAHGASFILQLGVIAMPDQRKNLRVFRVDCAFAPTSGLIH